MNDLWHSLMEIDDGPEDATNLSQIEELEENTYACDACGTLVQVDPYLTYSYDEWTAFDAKSLRHMRYWHSKYAFSKEVQPGYWLTFCRRVCEIKYDRQDEDDWALTVD